MSSGLYELEFNEGITTLTNNQIIWESTSLSRVVYPETITNIAGINASTHSNNLTTVISYAKTPPTLGSTSYISSSTYFYVPNESLKAYRLKAAWNSYDGRVLGFFNGPSNFYADGTYTYSLRSIFNGYTDLQYYLEPNDYVTMSVTDNSAVLVCSGIDQNTNSEAHLSYSFVYKGRSISGTIDIPIVYKEIIDFEDAEVKRICVNNWGGEYNASSNLYGVPGELTMEQAAAVEQLAEVFRGNTVITAFEELRFFTKIKAGGHSFRDCSKLRRVSINSTQWQFSYMVASGTTIRWNVIKMKNDGLSSSNWGTRGMGGNTVVLLREHKVYPLMENQQGTPKYYVPDDLVESYKTATNWTAYASRIYPLSEYTGEYPES